MILKAISSNFAAFLQGYQKLKFQFQNEIAAFLLEKFR